MDLKAMKTRMYGFSLIELLISLIIGSMVLIGVYSTLISNQTAYRAVISNQEITSSNRTITSLLQVYISQAGHRRLDELLQGSIFPPSTATPGTAPFAWSFTAGQAVVGIDNAAGLLNVLNGTDVIAIRVFGDGLGGVSAAGTPITSAPSIGCNGTFLPIRPQPTVITLYINDMQQLICSDNSGPAQTQTPDVILYEGVEQLQVAYGTSATVGVTYAPASAALPWFSISKTKVSLLIRNEIERSANLLQGVAETRNYNILGLNVTPAVDPNGNSQLHQQITKTILLPNAVVSPL